MSKNPIGLHILFAILGLGISLLSLGVGAQFILEVQRYDSFRNEGEMVAGMAFCVVGILCLIFSIALILRLNWGRIAFQVMLILGGIAWLAFVAFLAVDSPRAWAVLIGMGAVGLTAVIFGVLFLEHAQFRKDLQGTRSGNPDQWDILDQ